MIVRHLTEENDTYFILKDFSSYAEAQHRIDSLYRDTNRWSRMSAVNIACAGAFSSDYTIRKYAEEIWSVGPVKIDPREEE